MIARSLPLLLACLAFAGLAEAGKVYRWTDSQGRVHYSDRPVRNAEEVEIKAPGPGTGGASSTPEEATDVAGNASAECEQKRAQLERYRNAASIKETDHLGNEREYSVEDKRKLLARTEQEVAAACGG